MICDKIRTGTKPPDNQPYEVSCKGFHPTEPQARCVIGWTAHADGGSLMSVISKHPVYNSPKVRDTRIRERAKFWADDFDMDLLKVFPDLAEMLGNTIDLSLWTVGHERFGRLNHPASWNDGGGYMWLEKPNLDRERGWASISGGHVTNAPEIECTWLEMIRDLWCHRMMMMFLPQRIIVPDSPWTCFEAIMSNRRGWNTEKDIALDLAKARCWIELSTSIVRRAADLPVR